MFDLVKAQYREFGVDADEAAAKAVDHAGRDGLDIFDVYSARRRVRGETSLEYVDGEFVRRVEYVVTLRVIR